MPPKLGAYVHGYDPAENMRLQEQASTLETLLHCDTRYSEGSDVLEVGCGVGAQTVPLARNSPGARMVSIDISPGSLDQASQRARDEGISNVRFCRADVFDLPFAPASFDHLFVCFVLEHLPRPAEALAKLRPLLRPGGTVTVIEGDHGSAFFHPASKAATAAVRAQVELQRAAGGNADIGRKLYPLLMRAGYAKVRVSPRLVYVDGSRPDLADGFTRKTFTAMIEGIREPALRSGFIEPETFDQGVRALHRSAEPDGVFCYTFFKAVAEAARL